MNGKKREREDNIMRIRKQDGEDFEICKLNYL